MSLDEKEVTNVGQPRTWSNTRKFLLFVLLPALVAGFFSIAPKLYEELTKPKAALTYRAVSGPAIVEGGSFRQIFSIAVENSGKIPLTDVKAEVRVSAGQIESFVVDQNNALWPAVEKSSTLYRFSVPRMHPTESVSVSLMTSSSSPNPGMTVSIRSNEVLGIQPEPGGVEDQSKAFLVAAIGAMLSGVSVAVMSLGFVSSRFRRAILGYTRSDILTYIIGLSGVIPLNNELMFRDHELTYVRAGDLFFLIGTRGDAATKARCILALKALLLVHKMAEESAATIKKNLVALGETETVVNSIRAKSLSNADELREEIRKLLPA
jgi:hypothetical protein